MQTCGLHMDNKPWKFIPIPREIKELSEPVMVSFAHVNMRANEMVDTTVKLGLNKEDLYIL